MKIRWSLFIPSTSIDISSLQKFYSFENFFLPFSNNTIFAFVRKQLFESRAFGSYTLIEGWSVLKISLYPDGKFQYESSFADCFGHSRLNLVEGDFIVKGQYVLLNPNKSHEQYLQDIPEQKLIWDSIRPLNAVYNFYDSLLILPVNRKIFLLGTNSSTLEKSRYKEFTFLTHLGQGARHFLNGMNANDTVGFHWRFLHKDCQSCKETNLKESLPKEWKDYLITNEIKAKVTKVDSIEIIFKVPYVTIDAGKNQGIRRGHEVFSDSGYCFTILAVYPDSSKAICLYGNPKSLLLGQSITTIKPRHNR
ncbi:MAG: hypothetical protein QM734_03240 [Cyclobacteriaceae bacterium]